MFQWFCDNFLKAKPHKFHFLTNKSGEALISVKPEKVTILLKTIRYTCKKTLQKLSPPSLAKTYTGIFGRESMHFLSISILSDSVDVSQQKIERRYKSIHERALIVYNDSRKLFKELLKLDISAPLH